MAKTKTPPSIADLAAKALHKPGSITKAEIKALANAALTQATDVIKGLIGTTPSAPPKPVPNAKAPAKAKTAAKLAKAAKSTAKPAVTKPAKAKAAPKSKAATKGKAKAAPATPKPPQS